MKQLETITTWSFLRQDPPSLSPASYFRTCSKHPRHLIRENFPPGQFPNVCSESRVCGILMVVLCSGIMLKWSFLSLSWYRIFAWREEYASSCLSQRVHLCLQVSAWSAVLQFVCSCQAPPYPDIHQGTILISNKYSSMSSWQFNLYTITKIILSQVFIWVRKQSIFDWRSPFCWWGNYATCAATFVSWHGSHCSQISRPNLFCLTECQLSGSRRLSSPEQDLNFSLHKTLHCAASWMHWDKIILSNNHQNEWASYFLTFRWYA